jgi:hypothetical protein
VQYVVRLRLELQQAGHVLLVGPGPGVVVHGRLKRLVPEDGRHVVDDGAQQGVARVGMAVRVVVIQLVQRRDVQPGFALLGSQLMRETGIDVELGLSHRRHRGRQLCFGGRLFLDDRVAPHSGLRGLDPHG